MELAHRAAYQSQEWKAFLSFNDARTTMYDFYGVPPYEGNEEFYQELGISQERVFMYKDRYYLELTDGMKEDFLTQMAKRAVQISYEKVPMGERITLSIAALWTRMTEKSYRPMAWIVMGLLGILLLASILTKHWRAFLHLLLMIPASLIPWLYMIFMGRPVARVATAIWYADLLFLAAMMIDHAEEIRAFLEKRKMSSSAGSVIARVIVALVLTAVLILGIQKDYGKIQRQADERVASGNVRMKLEEWCEASPENLYVCESDVINLSFSASQMDDSFHNLYWPGGWPSKMPQAKSIWERYGITSLETALAENEHVYLIAFAESDMTYWTDFYRARYPDVTLVQTEAPEFDGVKFAVYQLKRN